MKKKKKNHYEAMVLYDIKNKKISNFTQFDLKISNKT